MEIKNALFKIMLMWQQNKNLEKISWLIFKHPDTAGKRQQIMNMQITTN